MCDGLSARLDAECRDEIYGHVKKGWW